MRGSSHQVRKPSLSLAARRSQPWLTYSSPAGIHSWQKYGLQWWQKNCLYCGTPLCQRQQRSSPLPSWILHSTRLTQPPTMPSSTRPCFSPVFRNDHHRATVEPPPPTVWWTDREAPRWLPVNSRRLVTSTSLPHKRVTSQTKPATRAGPFPSPPAVLATPMGKAKGPESAPPDYRSFWACRGCLSRHWRQWTAIGAKPWVVSVVRDGYRIPFRDLPPPPREIPGAVPNVPAGFGARSRFPGRDQDHDDKRGTRNSSRPGPRFLQPPVPSRKVFRWLETRHRPLAPKRVRSSDTIQDGNTRPGSFSVRKDYFLASIDLKDAYFQIPVRPSSRKLLHFVSNGTVYQFKALCFGLSTAPQVFTRVFAAVSAWAHS